MTVGYSGTPLPKKLGLTEATRLHVVNEPTEYRALLGKLPTGLRREARVNKSTTVIHIFVQTRRELERSLASARKKMSSTAAIWISWPKKASRIKTDVTEDTIREVALPLGLVDIKVCAVSDIWSGLKVVVRKELRTEGD